MDNTLVTTGTATINEILPLNARTHRNDTAIGLFQKKHLIPSIGIGLDCCTTSSHDLGYMDHFKKMFGELKAFLLKNQVKNLVVACPNCYKVFVGYGPEFKIRAVYTLMAGKATITKTPFTYINRLLLNEKKMVTTDVIWERDSSK